MKLHVTFLVFVSLLSTNMFGQTKEKNIPSNDSSDLKSIKSNISRVYDVFLVSNKDSTRKIRLSNRTNYYLIYQDPILDSLTYFQSYTLEGRISSLTKKTLVFDILYEDIKIRYKDGQFSDINNYYPNCRYNGENKLREVNINSIHEIKYKNPTKEILSGIGMGAVYLGLISACVVAPLVSINYQNGGFNENRFYKYSGGGLVAISTGLISVALTREKTYKLKFKTLNNNGELWTLQSRLNR